MVSLNYAVVTILENHLDVVPFVPSTAPIPSHDPVPSVNSIRSQPHLAAHNTSTSFPLPTPASVDTIVETRASPISPLITLDSIPAPTGDPVHSHLDSPAPSNPALNTAAPILAPKANGISNDNVPETPAPSTIALSSTPVPIPKADIIPADSLSATSGSSTSAVTISAPVPVWAPDPVALSTAGPIAGSTELTQLSNSIAVSVPTDSVTLSASDAVPAPTNSVPLSTSVSVPTSESSHLPTSDPIPVPTELVPLSTSGPVSEPTDLVPLSSSVSDPVSTDCVHLSSSDLAPVPAPTNSVPLFTSDPVPAPTESVPLSNSARVAIPTDAIPVDFVADITAPSIPAITPLAPVPSPTAGSALAAQAADIAADVNAPPDGVLLTIPGKSTAKAIIAAASLLLSFCLHICQIRFFASNFFVYVVYNCYNLQQQIVSFAAILNLFG